VKAQPTVEVAIGARGTGKTAWMIQRCARDARLIAWDYKHDPRLDDLGCEAFTDLASFIRAMQASTFRLRYQVDHDKDLDAQFDLFCRAAYKAGCLRMFVAELPEVTRAGRAPAAWRKCLNVGRDYVDDGERKWLAIIAEAQREAEIDKSIVGNADVIHAGRLGNLADCKRIAGMWGLDPQELAQLPNLQWIEKHADSPELTRGTLSFGNAARPAEKKVSAKKTGAKATPPKDPNLRARRGPADIGATSTTRPSRSPP
jgi:hypothetical protein